MTALFKVTKILIKSDGRFAAFRVILAVIILWLFLLNAYYQAMVFPSNVTEFVQTQEIMQRANLSDIVLFGTNTPQVLQTSQSIEYIPRNWSSIELLNQEFIERIPSVSADAFLFRGVRMMVDFDAMMVLVESSSFNQTRVFELQIMAIANDTKSLFLEYLDVSENDFSVLVFDPFQTLTRSGNASHVVGLLNNDDFLETLTLNEEIPIFSGPIDPYKTNMHKIEDNNLEFLSASSENPSNLFLISTPQWLMRFLGGIRNESYVIGVQVTFELDKETLREMTPQEIDRLQGFLMPQDETDPFLLPGWRDITWESELGKLLGKAVVRFSTGDVLFSMFSSLFLPFFLLFSLFFSLWGSSQEQKINTLRNYSLGVRKLAKSAFIRVSLESTTMLVGFFLPLVLTGHTFILKTLKIANLWISVWFLLVWLTLILLPHLIDLFRVLVPPRTFIRGRTTVSSFIVGMSFSFILIDLVINLVIKIGFGKASALTIRLVTLLGDFFLITALIGLMALAHAFVLRLVSSLLLLRRTLSIIWVGHGGRLGRLSSAYLFPLIVITMMFLPWTLQFYVADSEYVASEGYLFTGGDMVILDMPDVLSDDVVTELTAIRGIERVARGFTIFGRDITIHSIETIPFLQISRFRQEYTLVTSIKPVNDSLLSGELLYNYQENRFPLPRTVWNVSLGHHSVETNNTNPIPKDWHGFYLLNVSNIAFYRWPYYYPSEQEDNPKMVGIIDFKEGKKVLQAINQSSLVIKGEVFIEITDKEFLDSIIKKISEKWDVRVMTKYDVYSPTAITVRSFNALIFSLAFLLSLLFLLALIYENQNESGQTRSLLKITHYYGISRSELGAGILAVNFSTYLWAIPAVMIGYFVTKDEIGYLWINGFGLDPILLSSLSSFPWIGISLTTGIAIVLTRSILTFGGAIIQLSRGKIDDEN